MRAYRVAYDGRPFHGFQRQPDVSTVEDTMFDALRGLEVLKEDAAKPGGYAAAGRTDAGVSARAQTVAFEAPDWLTPRALNGELPGSIRAWASADVPDDFHATHDARSRTYVYRLYAPEVGGEGQRGFDDDLVAAALDRLAGAHDFHNLTPDDDGTERDLEAKVEREGEFLVVRLQAGGFARQLVRRLVGLVTEVGTGEAGIEKVERVFVDEPLEGPEGVAPAAAEPLVLWDVAYDGVDFTVDDEAASSARAVFGTLRRERLTASRVAGQIRDGLY